MCASAGFHKRKDELRAGKITAETLSAALSDSEGKADKANETVKSQEKEAEALRIRKEKIASGIEADEILLKETEERLNEILDGKTLDELMQEQLSFSEQIPLLDAVKSALKAACEQKEEIGRQEDVMQKDSVELTRRSFAVATSGGRFAAKGCSNEPQTGQGSPSFNSALTLVNSLI